MSGDRSAARRATSRLLRELLTEHPAYRRRWQQHVRRAGVSDLSRAGVAQVIAEYLWDAGERADTDTDLARRLRDRVRRALDGDKLTAETLTWFIQAFSMDDGHEHRLWATYAGGASNDDQEVISGALVSPPLMMRRRLYRTVSMFEGYTVNAGRCVTDRHVLRVITAVEDEAVYCVYTQALRIEKKFELLAGGQDGKLHEDDEGRIFHEIVLTKPLRRGATASLEYRNHFVNNYRPDEMRRRLPGRYENVDMAMQFDHRQIPQHVWFAEWPDRHDGRPVLEEPLTPDHTGSCHRFIPRAEQGVIGFRWKW